MVRVRFAPSPTGWLHLGNARTALVNGLLARRDGGRFILRIDDTDVARSDERYVEAIREDLHWLGLGWDEEHRQSARVEAYTAAFEQLVGSGAIYPCTETAEALEAWRAATRPAIYKLGAFPHGDGPAYWRFDLGRRRIAFDDLVLGPREVDLASLSDTVVRRADGSFTFLFASAVDDVDLGVSHIVRGADHVTNTGVQLAITEALKAPAPRFGHLPLVLDVAGEGLSKRKGALSLAELRQQGIEPLAIAQVLATLGTSRAPEPTATLGDLAARLDLSSFGHASPKLDHAELERQSAEVVRRLPFATVKDRLPGVDESFWLAIRANLDRVDDARDWWRVLHEPLHPVIEDEALCRTAADLLPDPPDFPAWSQALKRATGLAGRALFHPLRLALTARERGPELKALLTLLPRETVLRRLRGETA